MPNLIRAPSMPSVPSIPCLASPINPPSHGPSSLPTISSLRSSQSFDSSSGLARLQSSSKTLFFMSMNKSAIHGSFLFMSECRALFPEGNAIPNAVFFNSVTDFRLTFIRLFLWLLLCISSLPRPAQSAGPECGELPNHSPTPTKSHSLREPHRAAGPHFHPPVHLYQSTLHPQQCRAASAPQTQQQQFGTAAPKSQRQPISSPSQLPSSPRLLCRNKWSSSSRQNRPNNTQVGADRLNTDCKTWTIVTNVKQMQMNAVKQ